MDVTKLDKFIWLGDIHGPRPYEFTWFRRRFSESLETNKVGPEIADVGDRKDPIAPQTP